MTSRTEALVAPPSWGRASEGTPPRVQLVRYRPDVRWGIRARAGADVAAGLGLLAASAGLWVGFLLAVW